MKKFLVCMGGLLTIIWGIAHLIKGFGNITADNIRIIRMEWINEGLTLIFMGLLTIICTILNNSENRVIKAVYVLTFSMLLAMSVLSLNTGFKINFLPFKLCPLIFTVSGLLILQGVRFGKTNHYSN